MKKIFFCVSLVLTGLMSSCVDKYEEVDAESRPSWLGSSIYAELKSPSAERGLQGSFNTYLRLIDDLGEAETLNKTGSKTVFPANDEAFARFFQKNDWNVSSYEQLSLGQKKLLLYSSMLDNPLLLQLLPNVSNGTAEPQLGGALKHSTNVSVTDSIMVWKGRDAFPANNPYWEEFYDKGIDLVADATEPMMVHLTREFMLNNGITTDGDDSDFAILTGTPFPKDRQTAFIFNDQVIVPDVTCQNGYIHQMQDVVVPPGNMAQLLRGKENTKYISRILDYFAVPYSVPTTTENYNAWARQQTPVLPDRTLYSLRYLSNRSYDSEKTNGQPIGALNRINGKNISTLLNYDPGWNKYYQHSGSEAAGMDYPIMDMGAFFVPSDKALADYFVQKSPTSKGPGAYLIDIYGNYKGAENTEEHLLENLDSLHSKNPQVLTAFMNNLLKASFVATVPSKFESVPNDAGEYMGLTKELIEKKDDGKYDITFANNGAVYVMKELLAPDEYQAVLAPASVYEDMRVMNWAIQDKTPTGVSHYDWSLLVDFKYYLLSMSTNYAFFIPEDPAFDYYYLDPASLGHKENESASAADQPEVLHFYYDYTQKSAQPYLKCDRIPWDMASGTPKGDPKEENIGNVRTQLIDILNYHTVVLPAQKTFKDGKEEFVSIGYNGNHYYKTKHGGEIYVDGSQIGGEVKSGLQISNSEHFPAPKIKTIYDEKNGHAYRIDRVIQPPVESVYKVLSDNSQFSKFLELCTGLNNQARMNWAGINTVEPMNAAGTEPIGASEFELYKIFVSNYREGGKSTEDACLDYNVRLFSTYNYTLFAPDNTAMDKAFNEMNLPSWNDIDVLWNKWRGTEGEDVTPEQQADKDKARKMIDAISSFIKYHFVTGSVYADNVIDGGRYKTMISDEYGVAKELQLSGGGGQLNIKDNIQSGHTVTVRAGDASKMSNKMARDYWLGYDSYAQKTITATNKRNANAILTSSFCAVHQISEPLCGESNGKFF